MQRRVWSALFVAACGVAATGLREDGLAAVFLQPGDELLEDHGVVLGRSCERHVQAEQIPGRTVVHSA